MWCVVMRNLLNRMWSFFLPKPFETLPWPCCDSSVRTLSWMRSNIWAPVISIFATAAQNPQMLQITDDTFQLRCEMAIPQVKTITSKTTIPQVKRQWQDLLQVWTWNGPWCWVWVVLLSIIGDVMTLAQDCSDLSLQLQNQLQNEEKAKPSAVNSSW